MNTIQEVVLAARRNNWMGVIQEQKASGKSVKEWCSENNISKAAFYYLLKECRKLILQAADEPVLTEISMPKPQDIKIQPIN